MAVPFDQERLELTGDPVAIAEGIRVLDAVGSVDLSVSNNGTVLYRAGGAESAMRRDVVWASRDGTITEIDSTWLDGITGPSLSPDGRRVAVSLRRADSRSIWVKELRAGGSLTRLSFEGANADPWWMGDGRMIGYVDVRGSLLEVPAMEAGPRAPCWGPSDSRTVSSAPRPAPAMAGGSSSRTPRPTSLDWRSGAIQWRSRS